MKSFAGLQHVQSERVTTCCASPASMQGRPVSASASGAAASSGRQTLRVGMVLDSPQNSKDPICEAGATATSGVTAEAGLLGEHYTCRPLYNPSGGPKLIQPYNPLAILLDVPGTCPLPAPPPPPPLLPGRYLCCSVRAVI